jgi:hypothetical protein
MQKAEVVLEVLRERGRKGLPCDELYRQMFSKDMYLAAYGNIYPNKGAMTPGADGGTADGMSEAEIDQVIGLMRQERYPAPQGDACARSARKQQRQRRKGRESYALSGGRPSTSSGGRPFTTLRC